VSQLWLHSQARWLGSDSRASIAQEHTQTTEKVRAWANVIAATTPCIGHYHQSADALVIGLLADDVVDTKNADADFTC